MAYDATAKRTVETPSGRIAYVEAGEGPVALFVHGVLLNSHLWRHQLAALGDIRRCIALDILAHGDTEIAAGQDVSSPRWPRCWASSSTPSGSTMSTSSAT